MSGATTSIVTPSLTHRWRRWRGPIAVIGVLCLLALILAWGTTGSPSEGDLDPDAVDSSGSRAVATIAEEQGTAVTQARDMESLADAAGDDTLTVVTHGTRLDTSQADQLAELPGDLLLVEPTSSVLNAVAPGVSPMGDAAHTTLSPRCELPAAEAAGSATVGAQVYGLTEENSVGAGDVTVGPVAECYPSAEGAALLRVAVTDAQGEERTVTVLSSGDPLRNGRLRDAGNASLALNLLGDTDSVVWFIPDRGIGSGEASVWDLLPQGFYLATAQVGVVFVLLLLWRSRRLGPLVGERLPVVVSATETTEGRARLYHSRHASQRAAEALRDGFLERVRPVVGSTGSTGSSSWQEILNAIVDRTGRDPREVEALLYGTRTSHKGRAADADLVRFAEKLDELEREVLGGERRP